MSKADTPDGPTYWNAVIYRLDQIIKQLELQILQREKDGPHFVGACNWFPCPGCSACDARATEPRRSYYHTCPHCLRMCSCPKESRRG